MRKPMVQRPRWPTWLVIAGRAIATAWFSFPRLPDCDFAMYTFPYDTAPEYLLRDRDSIYGLAFVQRVEGMGIKQKLISPRSPWQSPYVERLIGSIRRECSDQVIVFNERQLRQILESYFKYYHEVRPHRSLAHDSPIRRPLQCPERGKVIEMPLVGGLHHHYLRQAA